MKEKLKKNDDSLVDDQDIRIFYIIMNKLISIKDGM